jgi:hypothetical protein
LAFIVISGKVNAQLSPSADSWITAKTFVAGEVIHLFSASEKLENESAFVMFDKIKLAFMPEKGSVVYGLDEALYKAFMKENGTLNSLSHMMKLKFSSIVQNNIYFEGFSEGKVDMLGPLLSLRRADTNDILFRNVHEGSKGLFACRFYSDSYLHTSHLLLHCHLDHIYISMRKQAIKWVF